MSNDSWLEHLQRESEREDRQHGRRLRAERDAERGPRPVKEGEALFEAAFAEFLKRAKKERVYVAVGFPTGTGKTTIAGRLMNDSALPAAEYYAPTHNLLDRIVGDHLADAAHYRGMLAKDNCLRPAQVKAALRAGTPVIESCCKRTLPDGTVILCPDYDRCPFQKMLLQEPRFWALPTSMVFHHQAKLGDPEIVVIDEIDTMWHDAIIGLPQPDQPFSFLPDVEVRDLVGDQPPPGLSFARRRLMQAFARQQDEGGVSHACFDGLLDRADIKAALIREKSYLRKIGNPLLPGDEEAQRQEKRAKLEAHRHGNIVIKILEAVQDLLQRDGVSGRLKLVGYGSKRAVKVYGLRKIVERVAAHSVFAMTATPPKKKLIDLFLPGVEIHESPKLAAPNMIMRQVWHSPTAKHKLSEQKNGKPDNRHHRRKVRAYILWRWRSLGRPETLIVTNQGYEDWLMVRGLPDGISVRHFNDIRGDDDYKEVGLLIVIGRPMPSPTEVELYAGILNGVEPTQKLKPKEYYPFKRQVEKRQGEWVRVEQHPDPLCDALLWTICIAEIVQAVGRGRGIRRDEHNPLIVDVLADVDLPLCVNEFGGLVDALVGGGERDAGIADRGWHRAVRRNRYVEAPAARKARERAVATLYQASPATVPGWGRCGQTPNE